jgi:hypothetical protein
MGVYRKTALLLGCVLLAAAQPVADTGPATLQPEAEDDNLQWAASVVRVNELRQQGADTSVKLFGVAGGDPAMNGLYTYLAFYIDVGDGWRVFKIGDFLEYRVVAERPGRVLLEINENVINARTEISARRRRLAVTWTPGPDGAPPTSIRVATAPAR